MGYAMHGNWMTKQTRAMAGGEGKKEVEKVFVLNGHWHMSVTDKEAVVALTLGKELPEWIFLAVMRL